MVVLLSELMHRQDARLAEFVSGGGSVALPGPRCAVTGARKVCVCVSTHVLEMVQVVNGADQHIVGVVARSLVRYVSGP